jgi:aerobic-type carbon monoxide dehydrogenase small subunit (CoxS/CutS family)
MPDTHPVHITVNGEQRHCSVAPRQHLVDFLRDDLGLTGSHLGCEHGVCGACTVRLDGQVVRGCLVLAVQADGRSVETIEGLTDSGAVRDLQDAFVARNALQCGYCTSGMLMAASELVASKPDASREVVREWMSGNYCRCTGYQAIVDAVCDVLAARKGAQP